MLEERFIIFAYKDDNDVKTKIFSVLMTVAVHLEKKAKRKKTRRKGIRRKEARKKEARKKEARKKEVRRKEVNRKEVNRKERKRKKVKRKVRKMPPPRPASSNHRARQLFRSTSLE